ncbi:MAG: hypothetical protein QW680_14410 [Pyrobaculum sp.]
MGAGTRGWEAVREDLVALSRFVDKIHWLYVLDNSDLKEVVEALRSEDDEYDVRHVVYELAHKRTSSVRQPEFKCLDKLGFAAITQVTSALEVYYPIALIKYALSSVRGQKFEGCELAWSIASKLRSIAYQMYPLSGSVLYDVAKTSVITTRLEYAVNAVAPIGDYLATVASDYLKGKDEELDKQVLQMAKRAAEEVERRIKPDDFSELAADVEKCLGPEYVLPAVQLARIITD